MMICAYHDDSAKKYNCNFAVVLVSQALELLKCNRVIRGDCSRKKGKVLVVIINYSFLGNIHSLLMRSWDNIIHLMRFLNKNTFILSDKTQENVVRRSQMAMC